MIDVSFDNQLPTSFVLSSEAVDSLRAAAATIILASPDLPELENDARARIVDRPRTIHPGPPSAPTPRHAPGAAK